MKHKHLTAGELRMLTRMREMDLAAENDSDLDVGELVQEDGAGWYLGNDQVSGRVAKGLLLKVLIGDNDGCKAHGIRRFRINEEGVAALKDPNYEPEIFRLRPRR